MWIFEAIFGGALGEVRTHDLLLRRQSLYPTELRVLFSQNHQYSTRSSKVKSELKKNMRIRLLFLKKARFFAKKTLFFALKNMPRNGILQTQTTAKNAFRDVFCVMDV